MNGRTAILGVCAALLLHPLPVAGQAAGYYDDPRVVSWATSWLDGDAEAVLASVEADLQSTAPHPFAPHVWSIVHLRSGTLEARLAALPDGPLKDALGAMPDLALLYAQGRYGALAQAYPPEAVAEHSDPWALIYLGWAAGNRGDDVEETTFMLRAAAAAPESYQPTWSLGANLRGASTRERVETAVAEGGFLRGTDAGRLLGHRLAFRPALNLDHLETVDAWLATHPLDSRALQHRGDALTALGRWQEAADARREAFRAYPFLSPFPWVTSLLRAGRATEARDTLERYFDLARPQGQGRVRDADLEVEWIQSLVAAGEKGRAREALAGALDRWPTYPALNHELASLDLEQGRNQQAAEAARKSAASGEAEFQENLLRALAATGAVSEAIAHLSALEEGVEIRERWYWRVATGLADRERYAEAVAVVQRGLERLPNSDLLHRTVVPHFLADRRPAEGLEHLLRSFELYEPYGWSVSRFIELHEALDPDSVDAALDGLATTYPWVEAVWSARARRPGLSPESQRAVWVAARRANPERAWPWYRLWDAPHVGARAAWALADSAASSLSQAPPAVRAELHRRRGALARSQVLNGVRNRDFVSAGLASLETHRDLGGDPYWYHAFGTRLFEALGDDERAAREALEAFDLNPDRLGVGRLWEVEANTVQRMTRLYRWLEKDPWDGDRLETAARRHARWGGSRIVAWQTLQQMKERDPDHFTALAWLEDEIMGELGAHQYSYERSYGNGRAIGPSENYIGWFDRARKNAQGSSATVRLDPETGVMTRIHPDGQVERRADHPVTGSPRFVQVGAAFARADYTESGDVLALYNSAGWRLDLPRDEAGRIRAMVESREGTEERRLAFAYDDDGRLTRIELSGVGTLEADRDDGGEVTGFSSPGGNEVARRVAETQTEMLRLLQNALRQMRTALPELPYRDAVLDGLRARHEADPAPSTSLELAAYLVEHVQDRVDYAREAFSLAEELVEAARDRAEPRTGVEAAGLWYDLASRVRPQGLGPDMWITWSHILEWVQDRGLQAPASTAARTLLDRVSQAALRRLEGGRWLPRSRLNNPAFWRRYTEAEVFPAAIAASVLPSSLLLRSNGDVVVGSNKGLSVLRRGYWEWFGFSEVFGTFSADADPATLGATSDVRALAEDDRGRLWVGTGNGLLLVAGDYDDDVQRWVTPAQGLPVPAVDGLARYGSGVVVGTARGLRTFDGRGPGEVVEAELADEAIDFLSSDPEAAQPLSFIPPRDAELTSVAFGPDGETVAVGDSDGYVYAWSMRTRTLSGRWGEETILDGAVTAVAFSPDGERLLAGSADGDTRMWDAGSGREVRFDPGAYAFGDYRVTTRVDIPGPTVLDTIRGVLPDAPADPAGGSPVVERHTVPVEAGQTLTLRLQSAAFDTYLTLTSPSGESWTNDDDERSTNSFLEIDAGETGAWSVDVSAYSGIGGGAYELRVERSRIERGEPVVVQGSLTESDPIAEGSAVWAGSRYDEHTVEVPAGGRLTARLGATELVPVLRLISPSGAEHHGYLWDTGEEARVVVDEAEGGTWRIRVLTDVAASRAGIVAAAFGPSDNPMTVDWRGRLRVWNPASGAPDRIHAVGDVDAVIDHDMDFAAAFSPDGAAVAATAGPDRVGVWSTTDGERTGTVTTDPVTPDGPERAAPEGAGDPGPHVTAVAFGPEGSVAVGSADGGVRVADPATGRAVEPNLELGASVRGLVWTPGHGFTAVTRSGLSAGRGAVAVEQPLTGASAVAAGGPEGTVAAVSDEGLRLWYAGGREAMRAPAPVLIGTPGGLLGLTPEGQARLADGPVASAVWSGRDNTVYFTRREAGGPDAVYAVAWDGVSPVGPARRLVGQEDIVRSRRTYGLASVPLDSAATGLGVLTDQGISVFHEYHFEHVDLPQLLAEDRPGVRAAASRGGRSFFLTSEGVYSLDGAAVGGDRAGRVYDIVSSERWGATFIARGDRLDVVFHDRIDEGPQSFSRVNATHLALTSQHDLVVNDGPSVRLFPLGEPRPRELFRATPVNAEGQRTRPALTSLVVDGRGVVWATAGPGLFRYEPDAAGGTPVLVEYNMFLDPGAFDARSDRLSRVVETVDGRIWVIASDEGYRTHQGMRLGGGVLEWRGNRFVRLDLGEESDYWFITGYTPISDEVAIVGTNRGFAEHRGNRLSSFYEMNDPSYAALREEEPYLVLGHRGARLDDETFLFPTASGVVARSQGQWFYPDRINRMLPDPHLSQYGGRTVHAVSVDEGGRIYAGTDRGLLIYDTGGEDGAAFLVSDRSTLDGLAYQEHRKFREEATRLLAAVDPESEAGRLVARYEESRKALQELQLGTREGATLPEAAGRGEAPGSETHGTSPPQGLSAAEVQALRRELQRTERSHGRLLAELEQNHYSLYQMLELKPLDLASLRDKIPEGEAVVQYLPLDERLLIHVVTPDEVVVREVDVPSETLHLRARAVAQHLRGEAQSVRGVDRSREVGEGVPMPVEDLDAELAWLYDALLRPIEPFLSGAEHVYVAAVGALTYLPFAALRRESKGRAEYAVERYAFGYLPSMYLLDLVLRHEYSLNVDALVFGNPDGTLPGAEAEARAVHATLASQIPAQIGAEASFDNLLRYVGEARVLHLATHGDLKPEAPTESTLLLAGDHVLTPVDIMQLPLGEADLVVLSACETGLGAEGQEYATLARSFAHAGAASLVATLWLVPDEPSRILMERFYEALADGASVFTALAEAQRAMIRGPEEAFRSPAAWSGYVPFGKPVTLDPGF